MFAIAKMMKLLTEKSVVPKILHFYNILQGYVIWLREMESDNGLTEEEQEFLDAATEILTLLADFFPKENEGGEPIKE